MFSALIIGEPGSGKTTVALTAPKPIVVLDIDNKLHKMDSAKPLIKSGDIIQWAIDEPLSMMGLTRLATSKNEHGKEPKVIQQQPRGYIKFVEYVDKLVASKGVVDGRKIGTVVLDTYTTLTEHLKRLILACNEKLNMTMPLYGTLLTNYEEINNTLLRLPCNVIFLCHQKVDKDELTGKISYRPHIEGQMADKIGKDFEEMYYMQKSIIGLGATAVAKYEMMTVGDGMRSCRTSHALPSLVEPSLCKIYGLPERVS